MDCLKSYKAAYTYNATEIAKSVNAKEGQAEKHLTCMTNIGLTMTCSSMLCMPYGIFCAICGTTIALYSEITRCNSIGNNRTVRAEDPDIIALTCYKMICFDPYEQTKNSLLGKAIKQNK